MSKGKFGIHGAYLFPKTLMNAVNEFEEAYEKYKTIRSLSQSLIHLCVSMPADRHLYYAEKMTKDLGV